MKFTSFTLWFGAAFALSACGSGPESGETEKIGKTSSALNTAPKIGDFAVYAEHSIALGVSDTINSGDIGVRSVAPSSFGSQLKIGNLSTVQSTHNVLAPSVTLGLLASVGDVQTTTLTNNGGSLHTQAAFPAAAMPSLPLAGAPVSGGAAVTVPAFTITNLPPGSYGALNVVGTLLLNPGAYSFASVTLANQAHVAANSGGVTIQVAGGFVVGQSATILPGLGFNANQLTISVAGSDGSPTAPAAVIGAYTLVQSVFAVPHGTLSLASNVHAVGAYAAHDVVLADHVEVDYQSGFSPTAAGQQGAQALSGYFTTEIANTPVVGPVPPSTVLSMAVALPVTDPTGLKTKAQQVSDPASPTFRQYISADTFASTYGALARDYTNVQTWASANGLSVTQMYPNRLLVDVTGPASAFERALFVNLEYRLRADGTQFFAPDRDPSLTVTSTTPPTAVLAVSGLSNFVPARRGFFGHGFQGSFWGTDFRDSYVAGCENLTGAGQAIGLAAIGPFDPNDITSYETNSGLSTVQTKPVPTRGIGLDMVSTTGTPDPEATLDVEMAISMAPQLSEVVVFEGGLLTSILNAMATTKTATGDVAKVLSSSIFPPFGSTFFPNADGPAVMQSLFEFELTGQSFDLVSGDLGFYTNFGGLDAADGITVVGGSDLTSGGAWFGSGGGTTSFPQPFYQANMDWSLNKGAPNNRNVPDVSMDAVTANMFFLGTSTSLGNNTPSNPGDILGGTSVAAPLWAGFMAMANQQVQSLGLPAIGFANPALYAIARSPMHDLTWQDVNDGTFNDDMAGAGPTGFQAVAGYDLVTGWGNPTCNLINSLTRFPTNTAVGCGEAYTCAVRANGTTWCAGDTGGGDLGNGTTTGSTVPQQVTGITNAASVSAGESHACVLLKTGGIDCWGDDVSGELGNGSTSTSDFPTPVAAQNLIGTPSSVGVGFEFTCALNTAGAVECWGDNALGTLGLGDVIPRTAPTVIPGLGTVSAIGVSDLHACALLSNGAVDCWGFNFDGVLGDGTTTNRSSPVPVSGLSGATAIGLGQEHACAIIAGGAVECWGDNDSGQLGDGTTIARSKPVRVQGLTNATAVVGGDDDTCALLSNGTVSCWGSFVGLGNGMNVDQHTPFQVPGVSGATAISAGNGQACALVSGGTVVCWGFNISGQLGDGSTVSRSLPEPTLF